MSKSGAAPIATSLSVIGKDLLFIGSQHGDSLLVKFTTYKTGEDKTETLSPDAGIDYLVSLLFYTLRLKKEGQVFLAEEKRSTTAQHQFSFSVADSLFSIAPIRDIVSEPPSEFDSGTQLTSVSPQLVACVGSGRSGALAVMRQRVVAEVLIEVPIP